jgi:cytoskeletal protein CcmA (bactofilin family)
MAIFTSRPPQSGRSDSPARRSDGAGLTIIAVGTTVFGDLVSDGVVKIEGSIEGSIRAGTQILVAPGAIIRGDTHAAEIVAGGEIHGAVQGGERVEIQAGAVINGDIRTQRIQIADGGRVNGQITMDANPPASVAKQTPDKPSTADVPKA